MMSIQSGIENIGPGHVQRVGLLVFALAIVLLVAGCQQNSGGQGARERSSTGADSSRYSVSYAKGFRIEAVAGGTLLVLTDPLRSGIEIARYRLTEGRSVSNALPGCTDLRVPVCKVAASSTTHAGFLSALGAGDRLMGCNNPERIYDSVLYSRFQKGSLARTGRDLAYNMEYLISVQPDLVLQTGIDGQFVPDPKLTGIGIPVLFILEWMESTPLGRAEWIKVFGHITGKVREADSLFNLIRQDYEELAQKGREAPEKVKVLTGNVFKGTWYMPGGNNYMSRFFEDAGMDYLWKDTDQSASLALSFESVVYQLSDAPVWISVNVDSLSQLLNSEARYSVFRAIREKRIYSIFNRINDHGGNDFWEGAVVRPDKVLSDLLAIAHPVLVPDHQWNFYKPLVFD